MIFYAKISSYNTLVIIDKSRKIKQEVRNEAFAFTNI